MKQMIRVQSFPVLFIYLILYYTVKSELIVLHAILLPETIWLHPMLPVANHLKPLEQRSTRVCVFQLGSIPWSIMILFFSLAFVKQIVFRPHQKI